jgi:hypothetical protein
VAAVERTLALNAYLLQRVTLDVSGYDVQAGVDIHCNGIRVGWGGVGGGGGAGGEFDGSTHSKARTHTCELDLYLRGTTWCRWNALQLKLAQKMAVLWECEGRGGGNGA